MVVRWFAVKNLLKPHCFRIDRQFAFNIYVTNFFYSHLWWAGDHLFEILKFVHFHVESEWICLASPLLYFFSSFAGAGGKSPCIARSLCHRSVSLLKCITCTSVPQRLKRRPQDHGAVIRQARPDLVGQVVVSSSSSRHYRTTSTMQRQRWATTPRWTAT